MKINIPPFSTIWAKYYLLYYQHDRWLGILQIYIYIYNGTWLYALSMLLRCGQSQVAVLMPRART